MNTVFTQGLFKGKVCLVTGGGSGIGKAISMELAALGATVVIASRNKERLDHAVAQICRTISGGAVTAMTLNIRDEVSTQKVAGDVVRQFGRIDCLVNNGGGQFASSAADIRPKGFRAVVETNLVGTWLMTHAVYQANPTPKNCSIVNIIADYFNGFVGMAHTGAARAGVDNLTRTLAREWGADGVRINSVAPGIILSSGVDNYPEEIRPNFLRSGASVPLCRCGTESETASAVVFLLSPAASYISGATLRVDGGGSLAKQDFVTPEREVRHPPPPYHLNLTLKQEHDSRIPKGFDPRSNL